MIDIHSGGVAHEFVLSSNLQARLNSDEFEAMRDPLLAFDAPYAIVFDEVSATAEMPHTGTLEGHARSLGKKAISDRAWRSGPSQPGLARRRRAWPAQPSLPYRRGSVGRRHTTREQPLAIAVPRQA